MIYAAEAGSSYTYRVPFLGNFRESVRRIYTFGPCDCLQFTSIEE